MEEFHELVGEKIRGKPPGKSMAGGAVSSLEVKVGQTKIVALKKYNLGPPPEVIVSIANPETAFCFQVSKLKDPTKKRYDDKHMSDLNDQLLPVEVKGYYLFQICGKKPGSVELTANQRGPGSTFTPYATPLKISVTEDKKLLNVGTSFANLWRNHPLHSSNGNLHYPCQGDGKSKNAPGHIAPLFNMQCMVRLCWALEKSGVNLSGMSSFTSCRLAHGKHGLKDHTNHFSNPYDFPSWNPAKGQHYTWSASANAPEPMPGLAAFWFCMNRTGIILFDHYFTVKGREAMFGGHIDLWNKNTMGNTINSSNVYEGLSAFLRGKNISFWPID